LIPAKRKNFERTLYQYTRLYDKTAVFRDLMVSAFGSFEREDVGFDHKARVGRGF